MKSDDELKEYANELMKDVIDEDDLIAHVKTSKIVIQSYKTGYHDGIHDNNQLCFGDNGRE